MFQTSGFKVWREAKRKVLRVKIRLRRVNPRALANRLTVFECRDNELPDQEGGLSGQQDRVSDQLRDQGSCACRSSDWRTQSIARSSRKFNPQRASKVACDRRHPWC